jgi:hypothetical protein
VAVAAAIRKIVQGWRDLPIKGFLLFKCNADKNHHDAKFTTPVSVLNQSSWKCCVYWTSLYYRQNITFFLPLSCIPSRKCRLCLKCDGARAETRFRPSVKRTSPFKSAGASVQSTSGSRVVCIGSSNAGYTMFRGSVKSTGYPLPSPVSPSLPHPCVTVCHHISTGLYQFHSQFFVRFQMLCDVGNVASM